jgi:hypothetical protein
MYPACYELWFATESQASGSQDSCASPIYYDLDQISYDFDHPEWTHNPSLSPINLNVHSLDDLAACINSNTPVLSSPALLLSIDQTGTRSEAPETTAIPFSDESENLALNYHTLLKSNTPSDLMCIFSANLIQRCTGTHWWEVKCPDCKTWIKATLLTWILSNLDALGYFNTLSDH